jgi:hypothetical protein
MDVCGLHRSVHWWQANRHYFLTPAPNRGINPYSSPPPTKPPSSARRLDGQAHGWCERISAFLGVAQSTDGRRSVTSVIELNGGRSCQGTSGVSVRIAITLLLDNVQGTKVIAGSSIAAPILLENCVANVAGEKPAMKQWNGLIKTILKRQKRCEQ